MRQCASDERLSPTARIPLALKKLKRDLNRWKRQVHTHGMQRIAPHSRGFGATGKNRSLNNNPFSERKLKKLRKLLKELGIDEAPWVSDFEQIQKDYIMAEVVNS